MQSQGGASRVCGQGGAGRSGGQGGADGTEDHLSRAEDHHGKADDHHSRVDRTEEVCTDISGGSAKKEASLKCLGITLVASGAASMMAGDSSISSLMAAGSCVPAMMAEGFGMAAMI